MFFLPMLSFRLFPYSNFDSWLVKGVKIDQSHEMATWCFATNKELPWKYLGWLKGEHSYFFPATMEFVPTSLNKIWDITKRVISYFRLFQAYLFSDTSKFWLLPQRIDWEGWKWQGGIKTRSADDAVLKGSYKYTNDLTDIGQSWFVIVLHNPAALNSSCWN